MIIFLELLLVDDNLELVVVSADTDVKWLAAMKWIRFALLLAPFTI
jgi:hypothetical protein